MEMEVMFRALVRIEGKTERECQDKVHEFELIRKVGDFDVLAARAIEINIIPEVMSPERSAANIDEWPRIRKVVLERDQYKCQSCGETERMNVHHIKSRANGGRNNLDNLITLCPACHSQSHSKLRTVTIT